MSRPIWQEKFHFLSSSHQVFVTRLHILFVCKGLERLSINKCSTKTELNLRFRCTYIVLLPRLRKSCSSQNTYCFKNNSLLLHLGLLISWFQFSWNVKDEKRQNKILFIYLEMPRWILNVERILINEFRAWLLIVKFVS